MAEYANIMTVKKGDIVRFKAFALRVEEEPKMAENSITLRGRISIDGCPYVTRRYLNNVEARIERAL